MRSRGFGHWAQQLPSLRDSRGILFANHKVGRSEQSGSERPPSFLHGRAEARRRDRRDGEARGRRDAATARLHQRRSRAHGAPALDQGFAHSVRQAERIGRLHGVGAAEKGLITRFPILTLVAAALVVFVGCHKNSAANHVPPPPTVTPVPAPATTATGTKPSPTEARVSSKTKPILVETGLASWYGPPYHNH